MVEELRLTRGRLGQDELKHKAEQVRCRTVMVGYSPRVPRRVGEPREGSSAASHGRIFAPKPTGVQHAGSLRGG